MYIDVFDVKINTITITSILKKLGVIPSRSDLERMTVLNMIN